MPFRIPWVRAFFDRTMKRIIEWDRKRIEEDALAKVQREEIRAILLGRSAQTTWPVQRSLPD